MRCSQPAAARSGLLGCAALAVVCSVLLARPGWAQAPGSVSGRVVSEATGEPLIGATVEVRGAARPLVVPTDARGGYLIEGIAPGPHLLRVRGLGYQEHEVELLIAAGRRIRLDVALAQRPLALEPVRVPIRTEPLPRDTLSLSPPDLAVAGARAFESTPAFGELGLARSPEGMPGQEPIDPSDVLYIRGAAADLKLVLLDGAPVYVPFHLGGLIPPFEQGSLSSAQLHLGGAPARYDGGLSYVMDLRTRAGRPGFHGSAAVDLLSARGSVEGSLGERVRYRAGARGIHGIGGAPFVADPDSYAYTDALARIDADVGEGNVSGTVFRNREGVWLDRLTDPHRDEFARWSNLLGSLRYDGHLVGNDTELTLGISEFDAHLPVNGSRPLLARGSARRVRLAADLARPAGTLGLRYGGSFDRTYLEYYLHDGLRVADPLRSSSQGAANAIGLYLDASAQPLPRLRLRGGVRGDLFSVEPTPVVAPRLTATWMLNERAAISLAAGRYHQYVRPPERISSDPVWADSVSVSADLSVARASHLSLALDQELSETIRLGLEGYFKRFTGLPGGQSDAANASGVDVWVRRGGEALHGWFGYSLAWVWAVEEGAVTSQNFSGRHLITAGLGGALGSAGEIGARLAYGAGVPFSAISLGAEDADFAADPRSSPGVQSGSLESAEAPPLVPTNPTRPYLRIDVDVSHTWTAEWGGSPVSFTPYLRILNALDRRDALFYRYDSEEDGAEPLSALPVVPVVGLEWRF